MGMMMWWLHEVKLDDLLYQFLTLMKIIKKYHLSHPHPSFS
jgi:hypothetical protein